MHLPSDKDRDGHLIHKTLKESLEELFWLTFIEHLLCTRHCAKHL